MRSMILDGLVGVFGVLFCLLLAMRISIVYLNTKKFPVFMHGGDSAHDFVHKMLALIFTLETSNILVYGVRTFFPETTIYDYLAPFAPLQSLAVQGAGLALAFCGLGFAAMAQAQMGESWRVGSNDDPCTTIIQHGLYKISRHPIYVGFLAVILGLFLAMPNLLTFACAVLAPAVFSILVRMEEEYQLALHGDPYREYLARTRRWL